MRSIAVITVARSDYGIYLPVLRQIRETQALEVRLIAVGMHLSDDFGHTADLIEADGFAIADRVPLRLDADRPEAIAKAMGAAVEGYASAYGRARPDIVMVMGDRFEMHGAALAALPFKIPVAHIHGGELTYGAFDDALRHSITKLSHLHFVATEEYGRRVMQMGEEGWRVTVTGAPGLDNVRQVDLLSAEALSERYPVILDPAPLLVTFHPVTLEYEDTARQVAEFMAALGRVRRPIVFTLPNADTCGREIRTAIERFVSDVDDACLVENFGTVGYFSMMRVAAAMVGNSSSGIIEAASFGLPVVNVGSRQEGRLRAGNVIDVGYGRDEITAGIARALDPSFRKGLRGMANPYGDGHAAERIVSVLSSASLDEKLICKHFHDI